MELKRQRCCGGNRDGTGGDLAGVGGCGGGGAGVSVDIKYPSQLIIIKLTYLANYAYRTAEHQLRKYVVVDAVFR
ncbi:Hypothetical predicted protein [Octopus vulgaris]|uniref:Uncharacterized protein n=1 Tax=Octopus vulgaris TaxID=6645 RepID=A0AA36B834_OCTVU|nr:Hypothetical predicted protein [Octopus vulgaris]